MPTPGSAPYRSGFHYGYVVLALIVLAVFCALGLGRFGYTAILPAMQDSLKLTNAQTGILQSWNLLGYLVTVVFAGLLAAKYGSRRVITIFLVITGLGMLGTGLFPTFEGVRWGRFLTGVGGAGANVPAMGLVSAWFGERRRGLASGIGVAGSSVGLMVTGPLVPGILEHYGAGGWRVCWYVLGLTALLASGLCLLLLRDRPESMGLRPLGEATSATPPPGNAQKTTALQWSTVYRSPLLWHLALVYFAFGFSYIIYATFFIRHLVTEGGFSPVGAGRLWLTMGMISGVSGFIWGSLSDRWGRRLGLMGVFLMQGTSFVVLGLSHGATGVYLSAGLFALTAWSIPALMAAVAGDIFGARLAPAALGLVTVIFGIGQVLGPYVAGEVADISHSFSSAFLLAGLVSLALGAGGSGFLPRRMTPGL